MMRLYIAGPMSAHANDGFNFDAFWAADAALRELGHIPVNPARPEDLDAAGKPTQTREQFMRRDVEWLLGADGVVVLDGWEQSRGALLEVRVARDTGRIVYRLEGADLVEEDYEPVLEEAQRLVTGDRGANYGHPLDDFQRTADMMTAADLKPPFSPEDVATVMQFVKISRELNCPKRDNRVDGPGYWMTLEMIHRERARRAATSRRGA